MRNFQEKIKYEIFRLGRILLHKKHEIDTNSQLYFRFMETFFHVRQKRKQVRKRDLQNLKDMGMELIKSENEKEEDYGFLEALSYREDEEQDDYA